MNIRHNLSTAIKCNAIYLFARDVYCVFNYESVSYSCREHGLILQIVHAHVHLHSDMFA